MKKILEKTVLYLHKKYGITSETLSYARMFAAPWLALLISKVILDGSFAIGIITLLLYLGAVKTSFLGKILIHTLPKKEGGDNWHEETLDKIGDKVLIIFTLIPFGLNLFTFAIILAESVLLFKAIHSTSHKKANRAETVKMILQALLIPILLLEITTNLVPEMVLYAYIIITIVATYIPIYSYYSKFFYVEGE